MSPSFRPYHWLQRTRNVGIPWRAVCLSAVGQPRSAEGKAKVRHCDLVHWHAIAWHPREEGERTIEATTGGTAGGFWRWLLSGNRSGRCTWVFSYEISHALALLEFWPMLENGGWQITGSDPCGPAPANGGGRKPWQGFAILEDPPFVLLSRPTGGPGTCKFVDLRNYGVQSLQALATCVSGVESLALPPRAIPLQCAEAAEKRARCTAVFVESLIRLASDKRMGGLKHTAAGQAFHSWRHSWHYGGVLVHGNSDAISLERDSLYVGRCEAIQVGRRRGPIYYLDAVSFYPSIAWRDYQPARFRGIHDGKMELLERRMRQGYLVICRARLHTDNPIYPMRKEGELIFPVGRFATTLCQPELLVSMQMGHLVDVQEFAWYEPCNVFRGVFQDWIEAKQQAAVQGNLAMADLYKRLANSLIGKFAQRGWKWVDAPEEFAIRPSGYWSKMDRASGKLVRYRSIGWHVQREVETGEHPESCPAISAWIYSRARLRLLAWMMTAGKDNVYYVDSDALIVNQEGHDNLFSAGDIDTDVPGKLRLKARWDWVDIRGQKHYRYPCGITQSGRTDNAVDTGDGGFAYWGPERTPQAMYASRLPRPVECYHVLDGSLESRKVKRDRQGRLIPLKLEEF